MHLTIENKPKLDIFVSIFQLLKNWNSHINMNFDKDRLYIQTMDKSHICLASIEIKSTWFSVYDCSIQKKISIDSVHFAILMNYALKHDKLELKYDEEVDADKLFINFLNEKEVKGSFDHFFELNLIDVDEENLGIPEVEYDVEFSIESKKIVELLTELNTFGKDLNIKCSETMIELNANDDSTKLKINIPVDSLDEYAISEGEVIDMSFSLSHLCKMCLSMKLCSKINLGLSCEYPMSFIYNLGDNSNVSFYIAPKIAEY